MVREASLCLVLQESPRSGDVSNLWAERLGVNEAHPKVTSHKIGWFQEKVTFDWKQNRLKGLVQWVGWRWG